MKTNNSIISSVEDVHLIVSNTCSLQCIYCYADVFTKNKQTSKDFMTEITAKKIIETIVNKSDKQCIDITFHGGEPLFLSGEWYEDVLDSFNFISQRSNKKFTYKMQTNLTNITKEHIQVFKKYKVRIGISLDGPPEINEKTRGKTNFVLKNIETLRNSDVHIDGIIIVLSKYNIHKITDVFDYFETNRFCKFVLVNDIKIIGRAKEKHQELSSEELFVGRKNIIDYLYENNGSKIIDKATMSIIARYVEKPTKYDFIRTFTCYHPYCGAGIRILAVTPDGNLYPCGPMVGYADFCLGHYEEINTKFYNNKILTFLKVTETSIKNCFTCKANQICNFDCLSAFYFDKTINHNYCRTFKMILSYLESLDYGKLMLLNNNVKYLYYGKRTN